MPLTNITPPAQLPEYFGTYIKKVPAGNIFDTLSASAAETVSLIEPLSEEQLLHRYQPDKWSIKEVLQHVIDTERIFGYRALSFARGEALPLPGFEQDDYAQNSRADQRSKDGILKDLYAVRLSTLQLFKSFSEEMVAKEGTASEKKLGVGAIAYVIAGHEIHHRAVLTERYLS